MNNLACLPFDNKCRVRKMAWTVTIEVTQAGIGTIRVSRKENENCAMSSIHKDLPREIEGVREGGGRTSLCEMDRTAPIDDKAGWWDPGVVEAQAD